MRGIRFIPPALGLPVLAGLVLSGCSQEVETQQAAPPPTVETIQVQPEPVTLSRELSGRTSPFVVAEVRPQVTGIVQERLFEEGGWVEENDILYQLDDATYRAEHARAQANLTSASASLELARINAERTRELAESNAVSQQDLDNAMAALRQAEAQVGVAEAAMKSTGVLLSYTRIISPVSGRIGRSSVTRGALVTANQERPLAIVQQLDPIYVDVSQSSREMLQVRQALAEGRLSESDSLPVKVILEDGTEYPHPGRVAFSEVTVDPTTGSFLLRAVLPNPDYLLLPGMYVRAEVGMGIREEALLVPQQAVQRGPSGAATVMVVRDDNTVEQRAVVTGQTAGNRWVINHGLIAGDRVIVEGIQKTGPGMQVQTAAQGSAEAADAAAQE